MGSRWNRGVGYRIIICGNCLNPAGRKGDSPLRSVGTKEQPRYVHDGPCPPRRQAPKSSGLVRAASRIDHRLESKSPGGLILPGGLQ